ncbi:hypothetical protein [Hamadaea tsunoensis]|uniref:hypothetical protein n=1 Tax=Hamadaea tsunoensis TaxID=53368 RepID=UPI000408B8E6|nr:hypothetical protein [Hamadaea tsunoensis]
MTRKLLAEVSAVVAASPDRVLPLVHRNVTAMGHGTVAVTADTVSLQGGWWYRGEWTVAEHPEGTLLVHRVYNVADSPYWTVALANKLFVGYAEQTRRAAAGTIAKLGGELHCATRLI